MGMDTLTELKKKYNAWECLRHFHYPSSLFYVPNTLHSSKARPRGKSFTEEERAAYRKKWMNEYYQR